MDDKLYQIDNFITICENNIITSNTEPVLEGLFNFFKKEDEIQNVISSWYDKIFAIHSFTGSVLSPFHYVKVDNEYIYLSGINYKRFLDRVRTSYTGVMDQLFIKIYNERDLKKFEKRRIPRNRMKIEKLKIPIFFAIELITLFNQFHEKYNESIYGRIAKQLYSKSWVSKCDETPINEISLDNLKNLRLELNDYQKEFIKNYNKLKNHLNLNGYILSFEQGMGKTITAIGLAECLNVDNVYIVSPNNVQENWMLEIRKYYDKYTNDQNLWHNEVVMCNDKTATKDAKFFIINNESIQKILPFVKKGNNLLIIDESQNFRNIAGTRVNDLLILKEKLNTKNILAMSGTPIKASPSELTPMIRLIDPLFTEESAIIYNKCFKLDTTWAMNLIQERFGYIIHRRTKKDLNLPNKFIDKITLQIKNPTKYLLTNVKIDVINRFNELYSERLKESDSLRKEFISLVDKYSKSTSQDKSKYINWIIKTVNTERHMSMHELDLEFVNSYLSNYVLPYIRKGEIRDRINWLTTNFIKMEQSSMGIAIGEIIHPRRKQMFIDLYEENKDYIISMIEKNTEKTIIFSQIKGVVDYINDSLNQNGVKSVKITGDVKDRLNILMQFKEDDTTAVLCATSQSLGTGVTLTEASQMLFFGPPWRSTDFDQCSDRIHRIGQMVDVHIYNVSLMSEGKNLSERMDDILNWSNDMYLSSIGQLSIDNNQIILESYINLNMEGRIMNINIDEFIRVYESNIIPEIPTSLSTQSDISDNGLMDFVLEADTNRNIPEIENSFAEDLIAKKVAYMIATSHEYKDKPNVEAGIKFAKNYKWTEKDVKLDKIQGINKPIDKNKVFEIAKSVEEEKGNKWPLVVVDKIHGIYPQSEGMDILFDGHHRKEGIETAGFDSSPAYYGKYTGEAEKDIEELTAGNESVSPKDNYSDKELLSAAIDYLKKKGVKLNTTTEAKDRFKEKNKIEDLIFKPMTIDGIPIWITHAEGSTPFLTMMYFTDKRDFKKKLRVHELTKQQCLKIIKKNQIVAESELISDEDEVVLESVLVRALEGTLTAAERKELPDNAFGLPSQRKYPLYLKSKEESITHIKQAIKFFHFCPSKDRKELAKNIKIAADKYGIEIETTSTVYKNL